jgi:hypothetical protein
MVTKSRINFQERFNVQKATAIIKKKPSLLQLDFFNQNQFKKLLKNQFKNYHLYPGFCFKFGFASISEGGIQINSSCPIVNSPPAIDLGLAPCKEVFEI